MFMDCIRKQTYQCAQYRLKICLQNMTAETLRCAFFFKENQVFGFPWRSTREDLSIDVSITNVGLILTKPG